MRRPYLVGDFNRLKYDHASFAHAIDGDASDAATQRIPADGLIRVPVMPNTCERKLSSAIWQGESECSSRDMITVFGLCIIHCGMRTCESCIKLLLTVAATRYLAGKGKDRAIINKRLNEAVWADIKVRKLISVSKDGKLNKLSLNGGEVPPLTAILAILRH